jgi:hypothetical protein
LPLLRCVQFFSCGGGHLACDGAVELRNGRKFHQCFCGRAAFTGEAMSIASYARHRGARCRREALPESLLEPTLTNSRADRDANECDLRGPQPAGAQLPTIAYRLHVGVVRPRGRAVAGPAPGAARGLSACSPTLTSGARRRCRRKAATDPNARFDHCSGAGCFAGHAAPRSVWVKSLTSCTSLRIARIIALLSFV